MDSNARHFFYLFFFDRNLSALLTFGFMVYMLASLRSSSQRQVVLEAVAELGLAI